MGRSKKRRARRRPANLDAQRGSRIAYILSTSCLHVDTHKPALPRHSQAIHGQRLVRSRSGRKHCWYPHRTSGGGGDAASPAQEVTTITRASAGPLGPFRWGVRNGFVSSSRHWSLFHRRHFIVVVVTPQIHHTKQIIISAKKICTQSQ